MKTTYRLDGKKITKKKLIELTGADQVKRLTEDAKNCSGKTQTLSWTTGLEKGC